ncbi:uncharacterized protein EV154DRAFT_498142 [Mucor mucedo]|uniref:uncharacterized protein n=1 Tax=Mucor mucedo TaxID=29922 RepID=UPI00221E9892|nr:uncharacterized protein EV154DRAFT_498142 [Mucor mucedo]KAI7894543.1 hypothetical protein EV154DRAFT_498142 [Mucor mucedo]
MSTHPVTEAIVDTPTPHVEEATAPVVETPVAETTETRELPALPPTPVAATTEEEGEAVSSPPHPSPSKSNPTKRLSIFLGKAKSYVDKKVHEKKPTSPKKEDIVEPSTSAVESEVPAHVEPVAAAVTEPIVVAEPETTTAEEPVEEVKPKSEKRKSILAGIFRSKSPVHKEAEVTPAAAATTTTVAKPEASDKEVQETPAAIGGGDVAAADVAAASATGVVDEEAIVEPQTHHEKENVIDQIKRSPLGKFFNKKKEVEHKEETPADVTTEEPTAAVAAVVEEEPAVAAVEAPVQPEEKPVSRPGSPLGRRITQMFRGFSSKKKVPTVEDVKKEEEIAEEPTAATTTTAAAEETTVVPELAVADTIENAAVEHLAQKEEEHPSKLPAIQSSA